MLCTERELTTDKKRKEKQFMFFRTQSIDCLFLHLFYRRGCTSVELSSQDWLVLGGMIISRSTWCKSKGLISIAGLNWLHYRTFSSICYMLMHLPYGWLISPMSHGPWPIRYPCCNIAWSCLYWYIMIIIICTFWPASPILFLLY